MITAFGRPAFGSNPLSRVIFSGVLIEDEVPLERFVRHDKRREWLSFVYSHLLLASVMKRGGDQTSMHA